MEAQEKEVLRFEVAIEGNDVVNLVIQKFVTACLCAPDATLLKKSGNILLETLPL